MDDHDKKRMQAYQKYHSRREHGVCPRCGQINTTPDKSMCPSCREKFNQQRRENKKYFKKIKLCVRCGKNKAEPNRTMCMECLGVERDRSLTESKILSRRCRDKQAKQKEILYRRAHGLCYRCGKRNTKNGELCSACKAYLRNYRDKIRDGLPRSEWPSYGLCYICGKEPIMKDKKVCTSCYEARLHTLPAMWTNQNNEYFRKLNEVVFSKRETCDA